MKLFIVSCLVAAALTLDDDLSNILKSPKATHKLYSDFKTEQHLTYGTAAEDKLRFLLFKKNAGFVSNANAHSDGAVFGINFFSSLTEEEKKRYLGLNVTGHLPNSGIMFSAPAGFQAPPEKLWILKGAVTAVKNQGSCGSCWTFGAVGGLETRYHQKAGRLRSFAEQEYLDCVYEGIKDGCNGGWMNNCYYYSTRNGGRLAATSNYGYTARDGTCQGSSKPNDLVAYKITGSTGVGSSESANIEALAHGSLAVAFEATSYAQQYKGGILKDTTCSGSVNHAVTAVGYTPSYVLVKNSWGTGWGDQGFVKFSRGYSNCGLFQYSSYPTLVSTGRSDSGPDDNAAYYAPMEWVNIPGLLTRISHGAAGVWGVNKHDMIYKLNPSGNSWSGISGLLVHVAVGASVWGVNRGMYIYKYLGNNQWQHIDGLLTNIDVSNNDRVWGVNIHQQIFRRTGNSWQHIDGLAIQVSVGQSGVWVVNSANDIFYRQGTFGDKDAAGTGWTHVPGKLKWVASGLNVVVGVNDSDDIFYRVGVTAEKPTGTHWIHIPGKLQQIDVDTAAVYGVNSAHYIYTGSVGGFS